MKVCISTNEVPEIYVEMTAPPRVGDELEMWAPDSDARLEMRIEKVTWIIAASEDDDPPYVYVDAHLTETERGHDDEVTPLEWWATYGQHEWNGP